ncbi:flagellar export chaperone FliS [Eubacterium xylanophilum]|uniref:flagellar export chaperone FliS n=1 Tax=Eubacterium xylanophilum TaxID=39497 RepID=UPI00047AE8C5|nr:flagellar export chaperone FliS [Eubacterium xylanophilum]MCR5796363.1 flagellar export chaperone FliS [Eubacterium sp.]
MEKDKLQEYATRVSQANKSELVVIMMEAILDSLEDGKKCLQEENMEKCRSELNRARGLITELMGSLDFSIEISHYLRQLYIFSYREICQGIATRDSSRFDNAAKVISGLLVGFREVAHEDNTGPVMGNTEAIYAGMTYGRSSLNEMVDIDVNKTRGYKA